MSGLSQDEAERRLEVYGRNEIIEEKRKSRILLFLSQFKSFLILILIAAAIVSALVTGEMIDAIVILLIVLFSGVLGYIQEMRAEGAIRALKKMAAPKAIVVRDGKEVEIESALVVPGDTLVLEAGSRVAADARLIEAVGLKVDESPLTGESEPVEKRSGDMVYMGTGVLYGRGRGIVTHTGMRTEFGKIAGALGEIEEEETPLEHEIERLGKGLGVLTIIICALVASVGLLRGSPLIEIFMLGVALAVAAVPEALPAVITIALALGLKRMAARNALVRRLMSVETLGSTSVICTDKTGTLTRGEMTVRRIYMKGRTIEVTGAGYEPEGAFLIDGEPIDIPDHDLSSILKAGMLCNNAHLLHEDGRWKILGDPTEGALLVLGAKAGIFRDELEKACERIDEIPFSSERKMMTTLNRCENGVYAYTKGACEVVLSCCRWILVSGGQKLLDERMRKEILEASEKMAEDALRVLAISYKRVEGDGDVEKDMVFLGLFGMIDPPRDEVKGSIATCRDAGIKTIMITGDHALTARAIATELRMLGKGRVITGSELDRMGKDEFDEIVEDVRVYARVSPLHKLRVIDALKRRGHIVAMTGDGVNDAPALKKADVGISMGVRGTDVAKEASDIVLTDDNFASIVAAVEEGRTIFRNIKSFFTYGLSCHIGEILLVLFAFLFLDDLIREKGFPLLAVQILWINLLTDGLPPIALSAERPGPDVMREHPRVKKEGIFTRRVLFYGVVVGLLVALQGVFIFNIADPLKAQTMVFTTIVISEMFNAFNWRSDKESIFKIGFLTNKPLLLAVSSTILLQILVIYLPPFQGAFHTVPLSLTDWGVITLVGASSLLLVEGMKWGLKKVTPSPQGLP
ncbi:MAG: ATPase [Candidatus Syntrophoarchaeum butanivorans]|uniref:ATPase n=2 Tax=Candidatus Syntropharchaeum butanivorans TaxID=1839936 RepID=A0A1F2P3H3_9EURY|nr:MAG: ATPase [Candidatus Syntrophoarchaeum butanivorans]